MKSHALVAVAIGATFLTVANIRADAAEVKMLGAEGMRQIMLDLGPRFERATGHTLEHLPKRLNRGVSLRERIGFKVCAGVEASMDGETVFGGSAWSRCWCGARWRYHPGNCGATWSEYQLCRALP